MEQRREKGKSGCREGGDEGADFVVGFLRVVECGGHGGAEDELEASAQAVEGAAGRRRGHAKLRGDFVIGNFAAGRREEWFEQSEFRGSSGGFLFIGKGGERLGEDGESPCAVVGAVGIHRRCDWFAFPVPAGAQRQRWNPAAASESQLAVALIGGKAFEDHEEKRAEAAFGGLGGVEPVAGDESGEEFLDEVFGIVFPVAVMPQPCEERVPVELAEGGEGRFRGGGRGALSRGHE